GLDTDNGSEFLNAQLLAYCEQERITFTRGRTANKNDQCYVEQKNGSIVRQLVGYDRFEGERAYRQLGELYRAARLYVNFLQPSLKLVSKQRDGGHVRRSYAPARTPFQQVLAAEVLGAEHRERLQGIYETLVLLGTLVLMTIFFVLAPVDDEAPLDFMTRYGDAPFILEYRLVFLLYLGFALVNVVGLC